MDVKNKSFDEFKSFLNECFSNDFSTETIEKRKDYLIAEKKMINASEKSYVSSSSHLKRQFSL